MGVYADVLVVGETELHDAAKDAVSIGVAGNAMDYMIWLRVIKSLTFIDVVVSGFWGL